MYFKDARVKDAPWQTLVAGVPALFNVEIWRDHFYIHTNDGAPRYRMFKADPKHVARDAWTEIVPQSDATLEATGIVGEHLVLTYLRDASTRMEVRTLAGKLVREVALPGVGTSGGISGQPDEDTGYFAFTSFTEPQIIFKTSMKTGKTDEWTRIKLPVDTSQMVTDQVFFPSKDGTKISMFLIHNKSTKLDGKNPTILYGYGGFNVSMTPSFASSRTVWLDHGGVYAIANLRGGGEYGEDWHKAGMLLNKQNVFDDFIAAAEYLVAQKYTSPRELAIRGGSNGGLLVAAAELQRPDLFAAAIPAVGVLDMLRFRDFTIGKAWESDYGSVENADEFKAMYAYSPLHNVKSGVAYPATLIITGDHDDRVFPAHSFKFAAAMQAADPHGKPILIRIETRAGHGQGKPTAMQIDEAADVYAFILAAMDGSK